MAHHFSRRRFLQALGLGAGAGLLMPLLHSTMAVGDGVMPRRFVFVIMGNGIQRHSFLSPSAQQALADNAQRTSVVEVAPGDMAQAPTLGPLASGGDLTSRAVVLYGLSSKITGGGHTTLYRALACSRERAQTVDAWLAERLHAEQPLDALRLGITESRTSQLQYGLCLQSPGRDMPIITNPAEGHGALFSAIAGGDSLRAFETDTALLDFALSDVQRVRQTFSGGSQERLKLENYLASLEELRQQQERLMGASDTLRTLAAQEGLPLEGGDSLNSDHPLDRMESQFRLATAALLGNLAPVVVLTCAAGNAFSHVRYTSMTDLFSLPASEIPWRHGVCHGAGGNPVYQQVLDHVIERQVEMIAQMARKLDATPEGDGTMLDHTAIVFMSDNGDAHHSTAENWPALLVGGEGLGLRTGGRTLLVPGVSSEGNRRVSNLFNTLGYAAGHPLDDFGHEPEQHLYAGPLAELM